MGRSGSQMSGVASISQNSDIPRSGDLSTPSAQRSKQLGATIVIVTMVGVQFIDLTLAKIGEFEISVQKLAAVVVLPVGALLLGRVYLPPALLAVGCLFLLSLSISSLAGLSNPGLTGYMVAGVLNVIAAAIFLTALIDNPKNLRIFCLTWIYLAVLSSLLTVFQFLHLIPLYTVSSEYASARVALEGYIRGTGLKFDPNFQATILVIGLAFTRIFTRSIIRLVFTLTILAGVLSTLSRMGAIIAIIVFVMTSNPSRLMVRNANSRALRLVRSLAAVVIVGYAAFVTAPAELRNYLGERADDITASARVALFGNSEGDTLLESSGLTRAGLLRASWDAFWENRLVGVGAGRLPEVLYQSGSMHNAAHNSYLELMCVGGVIGILTLAASAAVVLTALRRRSGYGTPYSPELAAARLAMFSFAAASALITFIYVSMFWILLAFCLAVARYQDQRMLAAAQDDGATA